MKQIGPINQDFSFDLHPSMILSGEETHCTPLARRSNSDRTSDLKPMTNDPPPDAHHDQPVTHRERWLVAGILVLGAVLRLMMPGSFHVEHYDEGVYASNRWFTPEEGARFPDRHLYAPPLWPAVMEMSQLALGTSALGVMLPGVLCGVITIWLIWRLVREWVGAEVAIVIAGLLAVNGYHIMFSRTALTDVPVTMLIVWGITAGWRAISTERIGMAIWAGILTGLAWSTKYNGWYPLAVTGAGLLAANLFHVKQTGVAWSRWRCWLVMLITAALVWLPAWIDLQDKGGYAAVAQNHAGYLEGWSFWLSNFRRQFEHLRWWDLLSVSVLCLALALFGLGGRLLELIQSAMKQETLTPEILSGWMALAWVSSLLLVTPLYHPYPRLALPLFLSLIVGAAFGIQRLRNKRQHVVTHDKRVVSRETTPIMRVVGVGICFAACIFLLGAPSGAGKGTLPWQGRLSAEEVAAQIVERCANESPEKQDSPLAYVIYVYSEPAIYYHLCRLAPENVLISPVANLGFLSQPPARKPVAIYLVTGPHAESNESYQEQWKKSEGQLQPIQTFNVECSDLLSLNSHAPSELSESNSEFPTIQFHLSVVRSSVP
ncbi:MAG: glycosyltransferase family 39 protein [Planctomycetaceae bacterium]|nr:glycosyltransferase family 39 protein [Planctomycetaceae bacterium]